MATSYTTSSGFSIKRALVLSLLLGVLLWLPVAHAQCGGSCNACAKRFGCLTAAFGKCCTQFFMHNGKRSVGMGVGRGGARGMEEDRAVTLEEIINSLAKRQTMMEREMALQDDDDYTDALSSWLGRRYNSLS